MCGIVGCVGDATAADAVLDGLRRLEYRGYDSSGLAVLEGNTLKVVRRKGKLAQLISALREQPLQGSTALGHTRWATHGRPSDENAHPHRAADVVVVHNGIIENFLGLRQMLEAEGCVFESETDTEIISHLIAREEGALVERVRAALKFIEGAYAIAVVSEKEPDTLVVAKNASPLVLGVVEQGGMIASDIPALLPYTRRIVVLNEGEIAVVTPGAYQITTLDGETVERAPRTIDWSPVMAEKGGHRHFMHKEMHEQPRAIADTLRGRLSADGHDVTLDGVFDAMGGVERIMLTACGTSYHACLVGRMMLEELARIGCEVDLASELRYRHPLLDASTLTVAISQSGETADTLAAIKEAKKLGSKVLAIVNVVDASIAREADFTLYTHAGPEIGVASTKAFITQVASLLLFAVGLGRRRGLSPEIAAELIAGLRHIPRYIERVLQQEAEIVRVAHAVQQARSALFLGRGYGYPVALEGALKLKEISYIHAEGYAAGELKHGPIALVEKGVPIIALATDGPLLEKAISNIQEVRARDGFVIAVATEGNERMRAVADEVFYVPDVDPKLMPLVSVVPLQLLSYHVADLRGTDIDQPRNLAKSVTVE